GRRHGIRCVFSDGRQTAGTGRQGHQTRRKGAYRRPCMQPQRAGFRARSELSNSWRRLRLHYIRGCGRLAMYGFHGRLHHVDLSSGNYARHVLDEFRLQAFVGGTGLGTSLLYEFAPPRVDPLAPANPLIFASAPLVGTGLTTTAKYAVVSKSPLTGFIGDSLSSSFFALELKNCGIDALVITGRAPSWLYLCV